MKSTLRSIADALDVVSTLFSVGAIVFVFANFAAVETGPEFMQIGLFSLMLAVIPYCLAGAFHRIVSRLD